MILSDEGKIGKTHPFALSFCLSHITLAVVAPVSENSLRSQSSSTLKLKEPTNKVVEAVGFPADPVGSSTLIFLGVGVTSGSAFRFFGVSSASLSESEESEESELSLESDEAAFFLTVLATDFFSLSDSLPDEESESDVSSESDEESESSLATFLIALGASVFLPDSLTLVLATGFFSSSDSSSEEESLSESDDSDESESASTFLTAALSESELDSSELPESELESSEDYTLISIASTIVN